MRQTVLYGTLGDMEAPITRRLLDEVRGEMARQRVTQAMLSQATDIPPSGLSRRLSGRSPLTLSEAETIARALDTDLLTLLQRSCAPVGAA